MVHNIIELVNSFETEYPERPAFQWVDDESERVCSVSFRQMGEDVRRCAGMLKAELGSIEDKHVALLAKNGYPYMVYLMAAVLSGAVAVPLNFENSREEIAYELDWSETDILVHDGGFFQREGSPEGLFSGLLLPMLERFENEPLMEYPEADVVKPAIILFTSGTTGRSKAVVHNQQAIFNTGLTSEYRYVYQQALDNRKIKPTDEETAEALAKLPSPLAEMAILPLYHCSGLYNIKAKLELHETTNLCLNLKNIYRDLALMPSRVILGVPMFLQMFQRDIMRGRRDRLGSLELFLVGGSMVDAQQVKYMMENGYAVIISYGMTEASILSILNVSQEESRAGSIGKKIGSCELNIIDGELCIRDRSIMLGYYRDEAATREVLDEDGWLHTGDLARIDADGYVYLTGRRKNLIILDSGENVSPEELEEKIYRCEAVKEVLVKEYEKKICAEIFCDGENAQAVRAFIDQLNTTMPLYKRIHMVRFRDTEFERTASGKIKRGEN